MKKLGQELRNWAIRFAGTQLYAIIFCVAIFTAALTYDTKPWASVIFGGILTIGMVFWWFVVTFKAVKPVKIEE